jgi:hypothetical protein
MTATLARNRTFDWALAVLGLFVVSLVLGVAFTGSVYSSPFIDDGEIAHFYASNGGALRWTALCQFLSALALLAFTSTVAPVLRDRPHAALAVAGGYLAAAFLALNGLVQWVLTYQGVIAEPSVRRGFHLLFFGLGGFAHVAATGVLMAALSLSGALPRPLRRAGLVIAAVALLSVLTFVSETATLLIPLGRFPSLVWLVAAGYSLRT